MLSYLSFTTERAHGPGQDLEQRANRSAVAWYAVGDDFADALHLANAGVVPFYTFDTEFCKYAIGRGNAPPVVNPVK